MAGAERHVVLLGKVGEGKSHLGNTLIGRGPEFTEGNPNPNDLARGVTRTVTTKHGTWLNSGGLSIAVTDTPGTFDRTLPKDELAKEIATCMLSIATASSVGVAKFLICISVRNNRCVTS